MGWGGGGEVADVNEILYSCGGRLEQFSPVSV